MEFRRQGVWQGVDYLHSVGVAHGDIKPDNLLLGADGRVRICDFGSAQLAGPGEYVLRTVGTPAFFTPEMCRGGPFSARAADLWALGVCLYIFVFGAAPPLLSLPLPAPSSVQLTVDPFLGAFFGSPDMLCAQVTGLAMQQESLCRAVSNSNLFPH